GVEGEAVRRPTAILPDRQWQRVAVGGRHACGVTTDGALYCWGDQPPALMDAVLAADGAPLPPQAVATQGDLRDVSSGFLTCALDVAGQMQCWGGQRADWSGNADGGNGPWAVKPDANWRQLSARDTHVCAITSAD